MLVKVKTTLTELYNCKATREALDIIDKAHVREIAEASNVHYKSYWYDNPRQRKLYHAYIYIIRAHSMEDHDCIMF